MLKKLKLKGYVAVNSTAFAHLVMKQDCVLHLSLGGGNELCF